MLEHDRIVRADLRNGSQTLASEAEPDRNASASSPVVSDVRGHQRAIDQFIRAIVEDGKPTCDGKDGRRSVALIEEIYGLSSNPARCL